MNRILVLGILALTAAFAASCTSDSIRPTQPSSMPDFARVEGTPSGLDATAPRVETKVIGPKGGQVNCGRYKLEIPCGALSEEVEITVQAWDKDGTVGCELLPHGLQFDVPVRLTMNLKATNMAFQLDATIYWWDDAAGAWVDMNGLYAGYDQTVEALLPHFSRYVAGRSGW